ncbi:HAD-IA family hydrolase [Caenimonas sedimenti]|uniref:HAD-IA family hydrolase n=1 Tax=Caenimonas sedimenti TaxID=2596921 RepID=A0A562ZWK0_9BURK|nr:HAD-IA family hydrolase [Caenimonas sedimenti]TWO72853.1 HAD-IA family hydrolase [Caenimonas sedimenti]
MNTAPTPTAQALVLDYGGVICLTAFERLPLIERKLDLKPGSIAWRGPFDPAGDDLWRDMLADRISEREYWQRRAAEVGRLVGQEWTEARMLMQQGQDDRPEATTRPEAMAAVQAVRAAGRRVGVLSNEMDLFNGPEFRTRLPIMGLMHTIVDATYTGILKPDARAYRAVAEALDVPLAQCLMVDDQPRNIEGARQAGMQVEWFDVTRPAETYARVLERLGVDARLLQPGQERVVS